MEGMLRFGAAHRVNGNGLKMKFSLRKSLHSRSQAELPQYVVGGDTSAFVVGLSVIGSGCIQALKCRGYLHLECGRGAELMHVHMRARWCTSVALTT